MKIINFIYIGLINTVMHWKSREINHENGSFLVIFGMTFLIWSGVELALHTMNIKSPHGDWTFYIIPLLCMMTAVYSVRASLKNKGLYKEAFKEYKSCSAVKKTFINLGSILFVWGNLAIFGLVLFYRNT